MMKKLGYIVLMLTVVLLFACQKKQEPDLPPLENSEISGERLWTRITEETDFADYSFWPDHEGVHPGQAPHGRFHRIYINGILENALPIADRVAPVGSIIVKENLSSDKELVAVTAMAKVTGYNSDHGDWFWAKFDPDGTVAVEGSPAGCINCHLGMKENDYIIIRRLDNAD